MPQEAIHALRAPCCLLHGETDGIIPLEQARALAANLARATLYVLRQTGHQVRCVFLPCLPALPIMSALAWPCLLVSRPGPHVLPLAVTCRPEPIDHTHKVMLERPQETLALIEAFIHDVAGRRGAGPAGGEGKAATERETGGRSSEVCALLAAGEEREDAAAAGVGEA